MTDTELERSIADDMAVYMPAHTVITIKAFALAFPLQRGIAMSYDNHPDSQAIEVVVTLEGGKKLTYLYEIGEDDDQDYWLITPDPHNDYPPSVIVHNAPVGVEDVTDDVKAFLTNEPKETNKDTPE